MKYYCVFSIVFILLGINYANAQDSITLVERYTVKSVIGRVKFLHHYVDNYWLSVNVGTRFTPNTRIRVPLKATLVLSDGNNKFVIPAGMEGKISSFILGDNNEIVVLQKDTHIGINANAGGLIPLGDTLESGGPSFNFELIKNKFYSNINLSIPFDNGVGFGFSGIFNYIWKNKIGDFYLGGGLGYTYHNNHFFTFGANVGYRFVTSFGMFFNAGGYVGGKINDSIELDIRPILGIGYVF